MRKIAFLQKTDKYSGAENVVITIMRLLPKEEYECVYISPDGEIRKVVEAEKLEFCAMPNSSLESVKKTIEQVKPDIIHATDYGMSSYAAMLHMGIPVVSHLHNNVPWLKNPVYPKTLFFALALPRVSQVISVSPSIEEEFVYRNLLKNKNHVIYNVVDLERVKMLSNSAENLAKGKYEIAFLGRLTPQKKPLLFCKIIKKYKEIDNNVTAVMIGDGEIRNEVEKYIEENNLKENITLVGFQKNPYQFVKNAKLLLMPSEYEGFGLAAVESLSLGKPVVCSGVGGLKNVVTPECGLICTEVAAYVAEIQKLLSDKEYYIKKSESAKIRAEKFGDMQEYIRKIIEVYDKCLFGNEESDRK